MGRKLRMGVIGLGMGRGHARGYHSHPQAELVALCDLDEKRLGETAEELGVEQIYTDVDAMFKKADLDGVSVALPNKLHAPMTIKALGRGLHVLCEKPMAITPSECRAMMRAAKLARRKLNVAYNTRHSPKIQQLQVLWQNLLQLVAVCRCDLVFQRVLPPDIFQQMV